MIKILKIINNWFRDIALENIDKGFDKPLPMVSSEKITKEETKRKVMELISKAEQLTPKSFEKDLPPMKDFPDIRESHFYENEIWEIGEKIRQLIFEHKRLRKDNSINERIINFCLNRNSKSGRQSFIMLLWYKHNQKYAEKLVSLIDDEYVNGHIIEGLNKLQVQGYCEQVYHYRNDERKWVKKQVNKYLEKYCTQQRL